MAIDLVVPADCPAMRLDQFVVREVPGTSRRHLRDVALRLNGRLARHSAQVHPGDIVSVPEELLATPELAANAALSLPILYGDSDLLAVDKPAGVASVALRADDTQTVASFLVGAYPETRAAGGPLEGGLVHRLDHETSGVLLAARSAEAYGALRQQFSSHAVEKTYLALVLGDVPEEGEVELPIAHDPRRAERMVACRDAATAEKLGARPARTHYRPIVRYQRATLLRVAMRSGVRHQVRVHLAAIEHPIAGDRLYGAAATMIARQALHASRIRLRHPRSGEALEIESPIPPEFEAAMKRLRP